MMLRLRRRRDPLAGRNRIDALVRGAAGGMLLRPWFDDTALRLLTQWYFPLSRGWAAALSAGGDVDRFCAAVPVGRLTRRLVPRLLARAELRRSALAEADARWEEAFFATGPARADVEVARRRAAMALMNVRQNLLALHMERPLPAIAWKVESPASVAARHAARLAAIGEAFRDPGFAADVEVSRGVLTRDGVQGWLRFPAPTAAAQRQAWARVWAPAVAEAGAGGMPTLIFAHGVAMEPEFTLEPRNPLQSLVAEGVRVIRPEGPWHGRRRLEGFYGGEPVLACGPGGLLDYFHAHVIELGRLVAWARATRRGPVVVGGVSLGALTAQLAAVAAQHWPAEMRPDAVFLVAPSQSLAAVTFEGSLTRALGVPDALCRSGWTMSEIDGWSPLLQPTQAPAVPPGNVVVVLGATDDVTLTAGGEALAAAWRVPAGNIFRAPAGHFSTSVGLARQPGPFRRLLEVLRAV